MTDETKTRKTNLHAMRLSDDLWADMQEASRREGVTVTELTRNFYAWYLRRPDAKMPKRPGG